MAPRRQRVKAKVGELTAEYYLGKLNELAKAKPTPKKHAPTTMELIKSVEKRWQSHCALIKKDPDHHLRECNPEIYKKFLHWVLNSCRVMKYSSIYQYWRTMKAIYRKNIGEHIDAIVNEEVFNYIKEPLVEEFNLDLSVRDKPVMSVNDLLSLLLLMIAYTASRPGAIVECGTLRGSNEALRYRDVDLIVLRNPDRDHRNVLVMKVRLLLNKGGRDTKKPKPFIFHERDDTLGICPIAQFIALALADDAFEAENLKTPEEILGVRVALPRNTIQLKWKKSMLDTPIFRRAVRYADGIRTSSDKALPYDSVAKYVKRLGRSAGFYQSFSPYCIRRGIANALDSVATAAERNLILGHSRSGIFEQYYLTQKRDVQSAYIGCPSKDALIRTMGQMSLDRDPRAPKTLTLDQSASIESHPEVKRLQQQKNQLYADLKTTYGKICKAKGTGVYRTYTNLLSDLRCARQARRTALMEEVIEEWHDSIHTKEVEKQAFGASVTEAEAYQIEPIIHTFEERSRLAEVLFRYLADEKKPECSARDLRAISIRDMTTLCALQEVPRREKSSFRGIVEAEEDTPEPDLFPTICPGTQCLFCLGNNQLSHIARTFSFSRLDVLQKHVESVHLWYITLDQKVPCPHPSCENVLDNLEHFLNHAQRVHNNKLASDNYFRQKSY